MSRKARSRIEDLENYLVDELKLSHVAALRRIDRMMRYVEALSNPISHQLCRVERWRRPGYRCAVFEHDWVLAYEVLPEGVVVREIESSANII